LGPPGGCKRVGQPELLLCGMADVTSPGGTKHVVVMGAGPAGLSAAYELTRHRTPVTVVEKDPRQVGGIARTLEFMGCRFDVGPHRFFSKGAEIEALWTGVLGAEMRWVARLTGTMGGGEGSGAGRGHRPPGWVHGLAVRRGPPSVFLQER